MRFLSKKEVRRKIHVSSSTYRRLIRSDEVNNKVQWVRIMLLHSSQVNPVFFLHQINLFRTKTFIWQFDRTWSNILSFVPRSRMFLEPFRKLDLCSFLLTSYHPTDASPKHKEFFLNSLLIYMLVNLKSRIQHLTIHGTQLNFIFQTDIQEQNALF